MSCGKTTTRRQAAAKTSAIRTAAKRRASTGTAKAAKARYKQQSYAAFVRQLKHYHHRHLAPPGPPVRGSRPGSLPSG